VSKSELSPTGKKKIFVSRPANANRRSGWLGKYPLDMWGHSYSRKVKPYSRKLEQPAVARGDCGMIGKLRFSFSNARVFVAQQCAADLSGIVAPGAAQAAPRSGCPCHG
jgi:hypothetical protein